MFVFFPPELSEIFYPKVMPQCSFFHCQGQLFAKRPLTLHVPGHAYEHSLS